MEPKLRSQILKELSEVLRSISEKVRCRYVTDQAVTYLICNISTFNFFRNLADIVLDNIVSYFMALQTVCASNTYFFPFIYYRTCLCSLLIALTD